MPINFGHLAASSALSSSSSSSSRNLVSIQSQRLKDCLNVFARWMHFPDDFEVVVTLLGAVAGNYLPGCPPVWLMIVGPSGGGKTQLLRTLRWNPQMMFTSDISEPGLLSWRQDSTGNQIPTGVLPDDIRDFGFMVIPEFSSILGMSHQKQKPLLGALRQVYDGAYYRNLHSDAGGRLTWEGKCGVIAASAPGIDSMRSVIGDMGERFVYYRLAYSREDRRKIYDLIGRRGSRASLMRDEMEDAIRRVLEPVIRNPPDFPLSDSESARLLLISEFSSQCRSTVERSGSWQRDVEETHAREVGGRIMDELAALFRGLLSIGAGYAQSWRILDSVMWGSVPHARARVLRILLDNTEPGDRSYFGGLRRVVDLVQKTSPDGVGIAHRSVTRALEELTIHGAIEQQKGGRKGIMDAWRVTPNMWETYALLCDPVGDDPRRGLFGQATTPESSESSLGNSSDLGKGDS